MLIVRSKTSSSRCGSAVTNLTSIHEDTGWIPGPTQWVKDPVMTSDHNGLYMKEVQGSESEKGDTAMEEEARVI